jgi:hypothetical protein
MLHVGFEFVETGFIFGRDRQCTQETSPVTDVVAEIISCQVEYILIQEIKCSVCWVQADQFAGESDDLKFGVVGLIIYKGQNVNHVKKKKAVG